MIIYSVLVMSSASISKSGAAPLVCSHGPHNDRFRFAITMPSTVSSGASFVVRVDSKPSGKISHGGLQYLFDMTTDYLIPQGTEYVDGSAQIVADTGSANVQSGAHVWEENRTIHYVLPAHVANHSSYTPPSIQFELKVDAKPGAKLALELAHYEVKAHAIIVGEVTTNCDPHPNPYTLAVASVR